MINRQSIIFSILLLMAFGGFVLIGLGPVVGGYLILHRWSLREWKYRIIGITFLIAGCGMLFSRHGLRRPLRKGNWS